MQTEKLRVLELITGLNVGGAEVFIHDLVKSLSKDKLELHLMTLLDKNDLLDKMEEDRIYPFVVGININQSIWDPIPLVRGLRKAVRYAKEHNIQIIHAHMTHALLVACVIKVFLPNTKIVFTPQNINIGSFFRELIVFLLRPMRQVDIVFSDHMLKSFYLVPWKVIIPNAVQISRFAVEAEKEEVFTFIHVARFEDQKNHAFLIALVNELTQEGIDGFRVVCVGKGELFDGIEQEVERLGLQDVVHLLGLRSDIPELLAKAHAFIMPSLWEGLPVAVIEAGAAGLPALVTPVGSVPSLIDEETGYLRELSDFKATVIHILNNKEEARLKGVKFRDKVRKEFDIQEIARRHEEIYERLIS